jgi:glutathione S-transferase kappa 1
MWESGRDVSQPETLSAILKETGLLKDEEIASAVRGASTDEVKKQLTANTEEAVKRGAYGAPWFWVTNHQGKQEPFFGSDRFTYMWSFLDLPVQNLRISDAEPGGPKL